MAEPNVALGYQPASAPTVRRADYDIIKRMARLEATVAAMGEIVDILANEVTVGSYISFSFNSNTTEPIVGNQVRINNASQTAATRLWVSHTTFDGLDAHVGFTRVTPGDVIYIQDFDDGSKWVRYTITASTDDGAYHDFTVTYLSGPANVPFQKIALRVLFQGVA